MAGAATAGAPAVSAAAVAAPETTAVIKPSALKPGDKVGVISPSSAINDPASGAMIDSAVRALGLTPVFAPHLFNRSRAFDASIRERLGDLHDVFADPEIKGVFCATGGYGISEIVAEVDYGLIRRNPKVFLGFSDITLLHLAIRKQTGLVTFHGHMPAQHKFTSYSLEAVRRAVCDRRPLGVLQNPVETDPIRPVYPLRTLTPGQATGRLVGGNLSMIMAAMGTPWEIDTRGAILVLEDVDEAPYSIARMLLTLRHAGKLSAAAGIVVGACQDCERHSDASPYGLNEQIDHVLGDLKLPVFQGLALGHTDEQMTIPLGALARMDATARTLTVLEAGVQ